MHAKPLSNIFILLSIKSNSTFPMIGCVNFWKIWQRNRQTSGPFQDWKLINIEINVTSSGEIEGSSPFCIANLHNCSVKVSNTNPKDGIVDRGCAGLWNLSIYMFFVPKSSTIYLCLFSNWTKVIWASSVPPSITNVFCTSFGLDSWLTLVDSFTTSKEVLITRSVQLEAKCEP